MAGSSQNGRRGCRSANTTRRRSFATSRQSLSNRSISQTEFAGKWLDRPHHVWRSGSIQGARGTRCCHCRQPPSRPSWYGKRMSDMPGSGERRWGVRQGAENAERSARRSVLQVGLSLALCTVASTSLADQAAKLADQAANALARDIYRQLIEINTTESSGSVTSAAEAMAERLRSAGFPAEDVKVLGPTPRKKNLVARLHGTGARPPILLIGHLDVVEAPRLEWNTDPFKLVERGGYFYGRGTSDMKDGDAILVTTLMRLKREGYRPDRDVILALTAAEEGGADNGVDWLVHNHRDLVDAAIVINEDGESVMTDHGVAQYYAFDATEKIYADFLLSTANPGGHSSLPVPSNAIYE